MGDVGTNMFLSVALSMVGAPNTRPVGGPAAHLVQQGDLAAAVLHLEEAYEAAADRWLLLDLASVYGLWTGHCAEAKVARERFLRACPDCAQKHDAVAAQLARLTEVCSGRVEIKGPRRGLQVDIDGKAAGRLPLSVKLWAGTHTASIRGAAPGTEQIFCVAPKSKRTVTLAPPMSATRRDLDARALALEHEYNAFEHLRRGALCEGIGALKHAHSLVPDPGYLFNVALAYDKWTDHCVETIGAFEAYLRICPACAFSDAAREKLSQAQRRCRGTVTVATEPAGLKVVVDGVLLGLSPRTSTMTPGRHVLEVGMGQRPPIRRRFFVEPQEQRTLSIVVGPGDPKSAPTPSPSAEGLTARAESAEPPNRTPMWISFGIGGAGLVTGAIFYGLALGDRATLVDRREQAIAGEIPGTALEPVDARLRRHRFFTWAGFGVATVGVATGLILYLLESSPPAEAGLSVQYVGDQISFGGRF